MSVLLVCYTGQAVNQPILILLFINLLQLFLKHTIPF